MLGNTEESAQRERTPFFSSRCLGCSRHGSSLARTSGPSHSSSFLSIPSYLLSSLFLFQIKNPVFSPSFTKKCPFLHAPHMELQMRNFGVPQLITMTMITNGSGVLLKVTKSQFIICFMREWLGFQNLFIHSLGSMDWRETSGIQEKAAFPFKIHPKCV